MSDSTDLLVRCKSCGRQLADVTVRLPDSSSARVLGSIRWALGLIRCATCQAQAPRQ